MSKIRPEIMEFITSMRSKTPIAKYLYNNTLNENSKQIFYSGPFWTDDEIAAAIDTLLTGKWLSSGENVHRFEFEFSRKYRFADSLMVNSGSSANLVLLTAAKKHFKWHDGDEIIVSPVGFPTTIAPIVQNNLVPLFIDIEWRTLNFDIHRIEAKITPRTKAIFVSPVLGNPPDISALLYLADVYGLVLLLDSCDSLGSKWRDRPLTDYFHASSFSFYPAHHITTLEGGMVSSADNEFIKLCRSIAWWGRDCYCVGSANLQRCGTCGKRFDKWLPGQDIVIDHKYVFTQMGYNLKPIDLQGAVGLEQLKKVDEIDRLRRDHKSQIEKIFEIELGEWISIPEELPYATTSWFGVPIVCKYRVLHGSIIMKEQEVKESLVKHLEENGIQTRNYFAGNILMHPGYSHLDDYTNYPEANKVLEKVFFIGCHPSYNQHVFVHLQNVLRQWKEKY